MLGRRKINKHTEIPPAFGEIELAFDLAPVSLQANSKTKKAFTTSVRAITKSALYLLSGDIALSIEWMIHEKNRYENDQSPDLDNILKPLLDALCGPDGLLVDDNQVQQVSCSWIDWTNESDQKLLVRLKFNPDLWLPKRSLYFVRFNNNLCLPMCSNLQDAAQRYILDLFEQMLSARDFLLKQGEDYYAANRVLPVQRLFHRTRLNGFRVIDAKDLRANLANS